MVTTIAKGIKLTKRHDGQISSIVFDYKRYGAMLNVFLQPQGITIPAEAEDDIPNEETMEAIAELEAGKGKGFATSEEFFAYLNS
jgi:hypothetical protein